MRFHSPACALNDRLHHDRRQLVAVARQQLAHVRGPAVVQGHLEAIRGTLGEDVLGQHAGEQAVHAGDRIAHRHRAEGVAVVAAPDGQKARAPVVPPGALKLQAHLDRDLDRHRPGVGEEHDIQRNGRQLQQPLGEAHRRLMREPAEHHVGHPGELLAHRPVQGGMTITVNRAPPRGHPVDQLAAVGQPQVNVTRRGYGQG